MESNAGRERLRQQLHEIERGESAAWVVHPPTPVWWPIGFGVWAGVLALAIGFLEGIVLALVQLGLVLVMGLVIRWDRRRRGTYPTGRPPRELNPAVLRMVLGAVVVGGAAWLAGEQVSPWLAVAIAAVGGWAVVAWYEHEYAVVAARVRERLA
ncbi:hypothetical protein [Nocardioides sp. LHG3406-4]|uniref:hypothetical protein n=1 Tax=Nocardioides sp. LHG3406-4 TaxID=2804575 RepID=UPI003CEBE860